MREDERQREGGCPAVEPEGNYWSETRQPIYALWVAVPMLVAYEVGLAWVGRFTDFPRARNGSDVLIQTLLGKLGIYGALASAGVVIVTLLVWQIATRRPWSVKGAYLGGVVLEGISYALVLVGLSWGLQQLLISAPEGVLGDWRLALVFSFGAGVYEEYVFRLVLVPLGIFVLKEALEASPPGAYIGAALVSGILFAASHHIGAMGWQWSAPAFLFRSVAGVLFAFFFLARGFAVTSLTHAIYDVGVTLLIASGG
ncbi:MAG: CPBP family intramembrane glutamic endopeptidase [Planctomycetota bacterium]